MLITKLNLGLEMTAPFGLKLALLGTSGGTHIGGSFVRAAAKLGIEAIYFDADKAWTAPWPLRSLSWHLADRRPFHLNQFSNALVNACARAKPEILVATGMAPLTESGLRALRQMGVVSVNYSTDDPRNPAMRSKRYLQALPFYDHGIYTAPLESPRFPGYRLSEGAIYAIRLRRNSICIACAVRRYCRP